MKWAAIVVAVVLVLVIYSRYSDRKECENRAIDAAVDTYPINSGIPTQERGYLQEGYKNKYIAENC